MCVRYSFFNISVVLKRLDDVSDDVRVAAVATLMKLFKPLPADYCMEISFGHLDALFSTMLIHLDDPDLGFQHTVLGMQLQLTCSMKHHHNFTPTAFEMVLSDRFWIIEISTLGLAPIPHVIPHFLHFMF